MPVVADVHSNPRVSRIECRVAEVAGLEIEFFPETGIDVRDVMLAILAEILAVGVDHRRGVVIDAGDLFLVNRNDDHHAVLLGDVLH